jgi:hypothetical protein
MAFKIAARTLLHLGAELISSDAVALYELIKNAFDAGSKSGVTIEVAVRLPTWPADWPRRLNNLKSSPSSNEEISSLKTELAEALDPAAPGVTECANKIRAARTATELGDAAEQANEIVISDTGHGMSKADLNDVYLMIGTRHRREQKEAQRIGGLQSERPILGAKGLGRLSVIRLGQRARVKTTKKGEAHWNILEIDWSRFSHDSDELLNDVTIEPRTGERKDDSSEQGTTITVSALNSTWARSHVLHFANNEAAKFNNPFDNEKRYRVVLRYNGEIIPILDFDRMVLNNCHAQVTADYSIDKSEPILRGKVLLRRL